MLTRADRLLLLLERRDYPEAYPRYETLSELFVVLKRRAFGDSLPACEVCSDPLPDTFLGSFETSLGARGFSGHRIVISESILTDPTLVVETMLHQMIHLRQVHIADHWKSFPHLDALQEDHGGNFGIEAQRLAKLGFGVAPAADFPIGIDVTETFYGLCYYGTGPKAQLFLDPLPLLSRRQRLDKLVEGHRFDEVAYFKTTDARLTVGTLQERATGTPGGIPAEAAMELVNSPLTEVISIDRLKKGP